MTCNTRNSAPAVAFRNRTGVAVLAAIMAIFLLGTIALAVDLGYVYMSYGQLQTCADSGAMAGAQVLMNDGRVQSQPEYTTGQTNARTSAVQYASSNRVGIEFPTVDSNYSNSSSGDVVIGYLADPSDPNCTMDYSDPSKFNAVQVRVQKTSTRNELVPGFFTRVLGITGTAVVAKATAVMPDSVKGFQITNETGNSELLPFAVKKSDWELLVAGSGTDEYGYDSAGNVVDESDGILEMNMYPLSNGTGGVAPGNFGTVDVGNPNNSTSDLERQIVYGVNSSDLAYFGGTLALGSNGTLDINGDTGISAGIKEELDSIKGKPRVILLYTNVTQQGNNATYTIVGFVGVRIMYVKLTGSMSQKRVVIQPAVVVDASAITGDDPNSSRYVYSNVKLVR